MTPVSIAQHTKQFRAAFSQFLKNRKAKKSSPAIEQKARDRMRSEIAYLDKNAIRDGDTRDQVRKLLGEPYGEWGSDSWLYPGPARNQFFRIDFERDSVSARYFATIYDAESGK
jgi:hypothetical protein